MWCRGGAPSGTYENYLVTLRKEGGDVWIVRVELMAAFKQNKMVYEAAK